MTETLAQEIERHEGFRATPYLDTTGHYTVGIGHEITLGEAKDYKPLTLDEARDLLDKDLATAEIDVAKYLSWSNQLSRPRMDVLVEMCFQIGIGGLLKFTHFLLDLRYSHYALARAELLDSVWDRQTKARCAELADKIFSGNQDEMTPWTKPPA